MLELDHLSRRYGDVIALQDLSLRVRRGQMYGFVGTNGAGKTTAMRIAMGVLTPDSGQVRWNGRVVDADVRREFGYMPEERGLYPKMQILDQLVYLAALRGVAKDTARATSLELLEQLGLGARVDDRVEELSLGNQQRVQLAASLVHDPQVMVLDEPFSGLDPVGVDTMADVLRERVQAGAAVIFSSHQLELVERLCDAIGIIAAGTIVADGTVDQLRSGGARRYRVGVAADPDWTRRVTAAVPGISVLTGPVSGDPTAVLELADGVDEQQLLRAAQGEGDLAQFTPERPSLAELFRETVRSDDDVSTVEVSA